MVWRALDTDRVGLTTRVEEALPLLPAYAFLLGEVVGGLGHARSGY